MTVGQSVPAIISKWRWCASHQVNPGQAVTTLSHRPVPGGGPDDEHFSSGEQTEEQEDERVQENVDEEKKGEIFHRDVQIVAVLLNVLLRGEALVAIFEALHKRGEVVEELVEQALFDQELEAGRLW